MKNLTILSAAILSLAVSGCAITSAGVKKGDERNLARSVNDVSAERVIKARMRRADGFKLKGVDVEVAEGIVVLSGNAPRQEDRIEAERIAWSAPRIDQVGNEIMMKDKQGRLRNVKDGFLEKSIRTRLTADKYVKARNLNVETHDGIVYLLGVARNQQELERAAQIASTTRGTREVISYVRVAGIPSAISQFGQTVSNAAPITMAPTTAAPARELPGFLTTTPTPGQSIQGQAYQAAPHIGKPVEVPSPYASAPGIAAPSGNVTSAPLSAPIPFTPQSAPITGPTAPARIADMGDRLNKEFPSDNDLGKFRTGAAGEAVSIIESAPYYIDPDTGKEIPVKFVNGQMVPLMITGRSGG